MAKSLMVAAAISQNICLEKIRKRRQSHFLPLLSFVISQKIRKKGMSPFLKANLETFPRLGWEEGKN